VSVKDGRAKVSCARSSPSALKLAASAEAPRDRLMLSESGLHNAEQLRHLRGLGFRGFLIGEALMRAKNPETALRDLLANADDRQIVSHETS